MVKERGNKVEACKAIKVWKLEDKNKFGPIFDLQADSNKKHFIALPSIYNNIAHSMACIHTHKEYNIALQHTDTRALS